MEQEIAAAQAAVTAAETELDEAVEEEETQERLVANEKKYVLNLKGQLEEMYNEMERLVSEVRLWLILFVWALSCCYYVPMDAVSCVALTVRVSCLW